MIIGGFIITIISWFINSYLDRKNEILKTTFEKQFLMYESFIEFYTYWMKIRVNGEELDIDTFNKYFTKFKNMFYLYGNEQEIKVTKQIGELFSGELPKSPEDKKDFVKKGNDLINNFYDESRKKVKKMLFIKE